VGDEPCGLFFFGGGGVESPWKAAIWNARDQLQNGTNCMAGNTPYAYSTSSLS